MTENIHCPNCNSDLTYEDNNHMVCTQCFHEWTPEIKETETADTADIPDKVIDSNGNELSNGDTVIIIKDLPVKGMPKSLKAGTKVKNIRLTVNIGGHNIDCKIDGFGAMGLKSEFVRKA